MQVPVAVREQVQAPESVQVPVAERAAAPGKAAGRRAGLGLWRGEVAERKARGKVTCRRAGLVLWRGVAARAAAQTRTTCRFGGLVAQVQVPEPVRVQVPMRLAEWTADPGAATQVPVPEPVQVQVAEWTAAPGKATGRRAGMGLWRGEVAGR